MNLNDVRKLPPYAAITLEASFILQIIEFSDKQTEINHQTYKLLKEMKELLMAQEQRLLLLELPETTTTSN